MKAKTWGIVMIFLGIIITFISIIVKLYRDVLNECVDCSYMWYTFIWLFAGLIVGTGFLLQRSDELDKILKESQLKINKELIDVKKKERSKDHFQEFLKDFDKKQRDVIEILHTYEGIKQRELENKISFSKDRLPKVLKDLETVEVISIMNSKKIYLVKLSK